MKHFSTTIRISFLALAVIIASGSFFTAKAQSFGVKAGINLRSMKWQSYDGANMQNKKLFPGLNLGVTAEFPIVNQVSFETGLTLSQKGMKIVNEEEWDEITIGDKLKFSMLYLDIPLTPKCKFQIGNMDFYGLFGPYLGIGLTGSYKYYADLYEVEIDESEKLWGTEDSHFRRLELGWILGAGYQYNKFQFGLQYNPGLTNIYNDNGPVFKNRVFEICVRYALLDSK